MLTVGPTLPVAGTNASDNEKFNEALSRLGGQMQLAFPRTYSEQEYDEMKKDRDHWRQVALKLLEAR